MGPQSGRLPCTPTLSGARLFRTRASIALLPAFPPLISSMSQVPEVLWAQRHDKVYLTITLLDAKNVSVKCEPQGLFSFSAVGPQGKAFSISLELYETIVPEGTKVNIGLRNIFCSVQKERKGWWKRLLKLDEKPAPYIKVDWNRWCDEDEEESSNSEMQSNDGDGALRGESDESEDEEGMLYLPDLKKLGKQ